MKYAVSIVTPPNYAHSEAFREVAEAIHYALLELGHDSMISTRIDHVDRRQIVLGPNLLPGLPDRPTPGSVLYNLEPATSVFMGPKLLDIFKQYEVWDYSETNIEALASSGITGVKHLPIGYVPQLSRMKETDEDIDVLMYGCLENRRLALVNPLQFKGRLKVTLLFNVWGRARDELIARSKIVLNVHMGQKRPLEQVRVCYLLTNRRFVISERGLDEKEVTYFSPGVAFTEYDQIVETCVNFVSKPQERKEIAAAGYELMLQRPQAELLRAVL